MSIQALREQKQSLAKEAKNLIAVSGDKVWTAEDKAKFDGIADQIEGIDGQIDSMQRMINLSAEEAFNDAPVIDKADVRAVESRVLFDKLLLHGPNALSAA